MSRYCIYGTILPLGRELEHIILYNVIYVAINVANF